MRRYGLVKLAIPRLYAQVSSSEHEKVAHIAIAYSSYRSLCGSANGTQRILWSYGKAIRRSKGLPQDAAGINHGYVSELENGLKTPSLPKVDAIAKNLGIHPLTLLTAAYSTMGPEDADQLLARVVSELKSLKHLSSSEIDAGTPL